MSSRTTFHLSDLANVASPDVADAIGREEYVNADEVTPTSGATFLRGVDAAYDYAVTDDADRLADEDERNDLFHEMADSAVSIWTNERWHQFTDLAGWAEIESYESTGTWEKSVNYEVDGLPLSGDMTAMAGQVLYAIALRLLNAIHAENEEAAAEAAEDDDES